MAMKVDYKVLGKRIKARIKKGIYRSRFKY